MNEKLKQEIDDWYNTMGVPLSTDALKETAEHFYNLALKDVKKFCKEEREKIFNHLDSDSRNYYFGQSNGMKGVLDFIDNLKK